MGRVSIGSRANARTILRYYLESDYSCNPIPKGWEELGSGISRTAYLGPDGVVYKCGEDYANLNDARTSARCRKMNMPKGWRIPLVHYFGNVTVKEYPEDDFSVIAMEHGKGGHKRECWKKNCPRRYCSCKDAEFAESYFGLTDIHEGNFTNYRGIKTIIDFGESYS